MTDKDEDIFFEDMAGEILNKQLGLLSKRSEDSTTEDLVVLTDAMCQIVGVLQSLSVGGAVSFPAQVQLSAQDLADLHRGQYERVNRPFSGSQKAGYQVPSTQQT